MIKAVVFDMDGVIVDYESIAQGMDIAFFKKLGYEIKEEVFHSFVGITSIHFLNTLKETFGMPHSIEELARGYHAHNLEQWKSMPQIPAVPGVLELINQFRAAGIPLALATSSHKPRAELFLN